MDDRNDWILNMGLVAILGILVRLTFLIEEQCQMIMYQLEDIESILKYIMSK